MTPAVLEELLGESWPVRRWRARMYLYFANRRRLKRSQEYARRFKAAP